MNSNRISYLLQPSHRLQGSMTNYLFGVLFPVHGNKRINKYAESDNAQSDKKINQFHKSVQSLKNFFPALVCANKYNPRLNAQKTDPTIIASIILYYLSFIKNIPSKKPTTTIDAPTVYTAHFCSILPRKEEIIIAVATYLATSKNHLPTSFFILHSLYAAKITKIITGKLKLFDEKLADIKISRIFAPELTLQTSFKAYLSAAFFMPAYQNSIDCCIPMGSCCKALLTFARLRDQQSFLFTNIFNNPIMQTSIIQNASRVEYLPSSTPAERNTVHKSGKPAGVTLTGDKNHQLFGRVIPVKVFLWQIPVESNQITNDGYANPVIANTYAIPDAISESAQLAQMGYITRSAGIFDRLNYPVDSISNSRVDNLFNVAHKRLGRLGSHLRLKISKTSSMLARSPLCASCIRAIACKSPSLFLSERLKGLDNVFITCSKLTYLPVRPSSIIRAKAASSNASVSTPSLSRRSNTASSAASEWRASSTSVKAYSPNRSLASDRLIKCCVVWARFVAREAARGVEAIAGSIRNVLFKAAKITKIITGKLKLFDEKLAELKNSRIFAPELTLETSFKAYLSAAFFMPAYQNSIDCCIPMGSRCKALLTSPNVRDQQSFLFTNILNNSTMETSIIQNASRSQSMTPESTPTERNTVHKSGKPAGITLTGDKNHQFFSVLPVEFLFGQTSLKSHQVADDNHADTVTPYSYTEMFPVLESLQLAKIENVSRRCGLPDVQNSLLDISYYGFGDDIFNIAVKRFDEFGFHLFFKDFITCSKLTLSPLCASSSNDMAYRSPRRLSSARLNFFSTGVSAGVSMRFDALGAGRDVVTIVCMMTNFVNKAAKIIKIVLRKVKLFDEKLADIKISRIFAPELTLQQSFKAYLSAAFFMSAYHNSINCCIPMGSCCKALLTVARVREQQFFLFTNIFK